MINYGFCYRGNKYDQFDISLELKPRSFYPSEFVTLEWWREDEVIVAHLKVDMLDETLMCYLRLLLTTQALQIAKGNPELFEQGIDKKRVYDHSEVKDLDMERRMLKIYRKTVQVVLNAAEAQTTLADDIELLNTDF